MLLIHFKIKSELERDLNDLYFSRMVTEAEFLRYQENSNVTALLGELRSTLEQLIAHRESYSFNQLCCHCWARRYRSLDRRANALLLSFLTKTGTDLTKANAARRIN
jgi:hypothetical protein